MSLSRQFRGALSQVALADPEVSPTPDRVDLAGMARAALNYLRGNPDPARDYECRFSLGPLGIPVCAPYITANEFAFDPVSLGDTDCRMDWQYQHMREMAGEPDPDPVELGVRRRVLSYVRDDHLCWINPVAYVGRAVEGLWIGAWTTAKVLVSLAETYQRTGDKALKKEAREMFLALKGMANWDKGRAWYPGVAPYRDGQYLSIGWAEEHGRNYPFIVEPCVRYWECTGDEEGLDVARAFAEGFIAELQPDQRELRIDPATGKFGGQIHLHTHAIWGVAHLGALLKESRYTEWARKPYEHVLALGTDYGWYPEHALPREPRTETCVVGDMVSNGVWQARAGRPHYWDQVERTVRNELRRAQFSLTPAFLDLFTRLHADKLPAVVEAALEELRKLEGGFVAQTAYDDWVSYPETLGTPRPDKNGIGMMGCCPPEGMRGLWEAWCGVVEDGPEGVFVNMSFSRDHPSAKVIAYRPKDGRLEVTARKSASYFLRPPGWVDRSAVRIVRNSRQAPMTWAGPQNAYVACADVKPGETLALTYPVPTFRQTMLPLSGTELGAEVKVHWVGNEVLSVEPRGRHLPMFIEGSQ